ncbi:hypothetical protein pb186bvf_002868 [Paramecium bursaria]
MEGWNSLHELYYNTLVISPQKRLLITEVDLKHIYNEKNDFFIYLFDRRTYINLGDLIKGLEVGYVKLYRGQLIQIVLKLIQYVMFAHSKNLFHGNLQADKVWLKLKIDSDRLSFVHQENFKIEDVVFVGYKNEANPVDDLKELHFILKDLISASKQQNENVFNKFTGDILKKSTEFVKNNNIEGIYKLFNNIQLDQAQQKLLENEKKVSEKILHMNKQIITQIIERNLQVNKENMSYKNQYYVKYYEILRELNIDHYFISFMPQVVEFISQLNFMNMMILDQNKLDNELRKCAAKVDQVFSFMRKIRIELFNNIKEEQALDLFRIIVEENYCYSVDSLLNIDIQDILNRL